MQSQFQCSSCPLPCTLVCKHPDCDRPLCCQSCTTGRHHRNHKQFIPYREVASLIQLARDKDQYRKEVEENAQQFNRNIAQIKQAHLADLKTLRELDTREIQIYNLWKSNATQLTGDDFRFLQQKANTKLTDKDTVILQTLKLNFKACLLKISHAISDFVSIDRFNEKTSQKHMGYAKNYFQNGHTIDALREYKKARNYLPYKFQSHFQIGYLQEGINSTESLNDAVQSYKLAHLLDKNNFRVNNNIGQLLTLLNKCPRDAISYLTKGISLQEDWRLYSTRARNYESLQYFKQAQSDYAKVAQMRPSDEHRQKLKRVQAKIRLNLRPSPS